MRWPRDHPDGRICGPPQRFAADPRRRSRRAWRCDLANQRIGTVHLGHRLPARSLAGCRCRRSIAKGRLRHHGGIVDAPGLYVLGLNFMRRRKSSFIHGAEDDVRELGDSDLLADRFARRELPCATRDKGAARSGSSRELAC